MRSVVAVVLACAASISIAAADPAGVLRVDLSEFDPARLDELPGILPEEAARLGAVAGPGTDRLADRLEASGIAIDRLLSWAPFLVLSGGERVSWGWKARFDASRNPARPLERRSRLTLHRGRVTAAFDAKLQESASERLDPIAWIAFRAPRGDGSLRVGTIAGGFRGVDAWDDPLAPGQGLVPSSGKLSVREARGGLGAIVESNRAGGSLWSSAGGFEGAALSTGMGFARLWGGADRRDGWGSGFSIANRDREIGAAWSRPLDQPAALRLWLNSGGSAGAVLAISTAPRSDRRRGSAAAHRTARMGSVYASVRSEMVIAQSKGDSQGRLEVAVRGRRGGIEWEGRLARRSGSSSWEASARPLRSGATSLRLECRGRRTRGRSVSFVALRLARGAGGAARVDGEILMRGSRSVAWPEPGAGLMGRAAARIGVAADLRGARCRFQMIAAGMECWRRPPAIGWRIGLERSAEG